MPIRRVWIAIRRFVRKIVRQNDPPERIARGVSAGFFAAAFPIPGVQIPLSLFFSWLVRGNAAVSIISQAISNPFTAVPLAIAEYRVGIWLWPGRTMDSDVALQTLRNAGEAWTWSEPIASLTRFLSALGGMGLEGLGPFMLGVIATGIAAAAVGYPLTVVVVWAWRAQRRRRRLAKGLLPKTPGPFLLEHSTCPRLEPEEIIARYTRQTSDFIDAERALLLVDGRQAYPEMLAAIHAARERIDLETYILRSDRTGERFRCALCQAARRGVKVRLLYDAVGSLGLNQTFVERLLAAGVKVRVFHPLYLWRPSWAFNRRDHRKILIVDNRVSFTGGLNIADDYAALEDGGGGWRDTHVRLTGVQAALELGEVFLRGWRKSKRHDLTKLTAKARESSVLHEDPDDTDVSVKAEVDASSEATAHECKPVRVGVVSNQEFRMRRRIRRAYIHAIKHAKHYILIENAYFIPDRGVRKALLKAARRGVKVAVAVAHTSDVAVAAMAGRAIYGELLAGGVRLFEWPKTMLHAKTAVIDDAWSVVGSYNFDHRSLLHNLEVVVVFADADFATGLREQTMADLKKCHELTLEELDARPWYQVLLESAAYQMRYWL